MQKTFSLILFSYPFFSFMSSFFSLSFAFSLHFMHIYIFNCNCLSYHIQFDFKIRKYFFSSHSYIESFLIFQSVSYRSNSFIQIKPNMLLTNRMASIPCSSHHSVTYIKDVEHLFRKQTQNSRLTFIPQPTSSGLQYFNMRVTQRLRRYRSMKKQWQEVATSVQNTSLSPTCESPIPHDTTKNPLVQTQKPTGEVRAYCINDYINSTAAVKDYNEKNSVDSDPLHSRIQQDLIKLRKFIKAKQKKNVENSSYKTLMSSIRPSGEVVSANRIRKEREICDKL